MDAQIPDFTTRLARSPSEVAAGQRLRYGVFVEEMGGDGALVDHDARLERDEFDTHAEHLLLLDRARSTEEQVVGVYRLLDRAGARAAGRFYSESEYDLSPLIDGGRPVLELGRSCLHPQYRGGVGMLHLWQGLAQIVETRGIELVFGVASFAGTDLRHLAAPLALLQRDHLAPEDLRVRSRCPADIEPLTKVDRVQAMKQVPALIKSYLKLGGFVGEGAFVDEAFNTTDLCLILDIARMTDRQRKVYRAPLPR